MLIIYKKFCCGIFYLLRDKARSDIPFFATFMFTLFLFGLAVHGVDSMVYLIFDTSYIFNKYIMYVLTALIAIPNYFFVFKDKKFLDYYDERLPSLIVLLMVFLIFGGSLALILLAGPRNVHA